MFFDDILAGNIAYTNHDLIDGSIRGVCMRFHAYGDKDLISSPCPIDKALAGSGILSVFPFYDVWGFGNDISVSVSDALYSALSEKFALKKDTPLVLFGEGVGATVALNCARWGKNIAPIACICACPVTDLVAHSRSRGDMDAVYFTSFRHRGLSFDEAVAEANPIEHTDEMPEICYRFILPSVRDERVYHDKFDRGIIPAEQYDAYIAKMQDRGFDIAKESFDIANCPLDADAQKRAAEMICNMITTR